MSSLDPPKNFSEIIFAGKKPALARPKTKTLTFKNPMGHAKAVKRSFTLEDPRKNSHGMGVYDDWAGCTIGLYRDDPGMEFIKKLRSEEKQLRTRMLFENEKLRRFLLKTDDRRELKLLTSKTKSLQNKVVKSQIRKVFKRILWESDLDLCLKFDLQKGFFESCSIEKCPDFDFVKLTLMGGKKRMEDKEESFMKLDDEGERREYQKEYMREETESYNNLFVQDPRRIESKVREGGM